MQRLRTNVSNALRVFSLRLYARQVKYVPSKLRSSTRRWQMVVLMSSCLINLC